ncbi:MAG: type III-A CRISPR-associated RAMP protein Csm3 [Sphaerochaetaceae bacterium]|nr:type III-A CRISPR-associated RAMP protein Csm3 [Sphaerochaetaceae bacterium]
MEKLIKKVMVKTVMELITGLHIGDSSDNVEIGGIDKSIVRRTIDKVPYIPGSSIKGKMRCLLEQMAGASEIGGSSRVNQVFGFAKNNLPSKLIVRDAYMTPESITKLDNSEFVDLPYSEVKFENSIGRVDGKATNPRQIERIPAGLSFFVEFVINVWDSEEDGEKSLEMLKSGIKALENDYLGGNGSRGYGQVKFGDLITEDVVLTNTTD